MSQKNYPLHKIVKASQNRPPWIREDPDSPIWPRSALDTSQIMPLWGGTCSFWSCYNSSNYNPVRRSNVVWFVRERWNRCAGLRDLMKRIKLSKEMKTVLAITKWKRVKKKRKWTVFLLPPMFLFMRGKLSIFAFMYKTFGKQVSLLRKF